MNDQLLTAQTVIRFGRERAQHDPCVQVRGDDTRGYYVQVETKCGRVVSNENDSKIQGFVTCEQCKDARP